MTVIPDNLAQFLDIPAVITGQKRLSVDEAMQLYHHASIHDLGEWASAVCNRIHGQTTRTYIIDRNINYTNICSAKCTFCAFKRDVDDTEEGYTLTDAELFDKVQQLSDIGGTQILLQGGMNPLLPIEFYEDQLHKLKSRFPHIHVHGYSPPEFVEFIAMCELEGHPTPGVGRSSELSDEQWQAKLLAIMERLQAAGLDSIPGGGAEIFAEPVRKKIGYGKASARQWLDVMSVAHQHGMFTSATMMFGHIEGIADRIDHMQRIRDTQDKAIENKWPGKYVSFIAWPFQRDNTPLGRLPDFDIESGQPFPGDVLAEGGEHPQAGKVLRTAGASEYLRMQAISRLFLDNIHSIGSSWVTMGPKIGQLGLFYGANDVGSVMMEENVVSAAGTTYKLNEAYLCHMIRTAGFTPAKRDNQYNLLKVHNSDDAPDLQVKNWAAQRIEKG